jgi:(p)ppGpp synthase/HD superfamily hydrolase
MFFLHRTKEVHDWTEEFGINEMQADYIEDAETGDRGYSEALVRINDDWYPLKVSAMDREAAVVDFDPREDDPTNLPGLEQYRDNKIVKHIRKELRHGTRKPVVPNGEPPLNGELFVDSWQTLSDDERRKLDLLNGPELESVLDQIAQGKHPRRAVNESVERKVQSVLDVDDLAESDTAADQTEQSNDQQGPALQTTD